MNSSWFSDEAHFHLNGAINIHNTIFWDAEPLEEVDDTSLKDPNSTCFCAFNARWGILGPYWFEDANGKMVTVNGEWYSEVLRRFLADLTELLSPNQRRLARFMQDGTQPHTAGETIDIIH